MLKLRGDSLKCRPVAYHLRWRYVSRILRGRERSCVAIFSLSRLFRYLPDYGPINSQSRKRLREIDDRTCLLYSRIEFYSDTIQHSDTEARLAFIRQLFRWIICLERGTRVNGLAIEILNGELFDPFESARGISPYLVFYLNAGESIETLLSTYLVYKHRISSFYQSENSLARRKLSVKVKILGNDLNRVFIDLFYS